MRLIIAILAVASTGCAHQKASEMERPQSQFFDRLTALCGKAYAGRLTTTEAADADMAGRQW